MSFLKSKLDKEDFLLGLGVVAFLYRTAQLGVTAMLTRLLDLFIILTIFNFISEKVRKWKES